MGLIGIAAAYYVYVLNPDLPERLATVGQPLSEPLNKWHVDEAYDRLFVQTLFDNFQALEAC